MKSDDANQPPNNEDDGNDIEYIPHKIIFIINKKSSVIVTDDHDDLFTCCGDCDRYSVGCYLCFVDRDLFSSYYVQDGL